MRLLVAAPLIFGASALIIARGRALDAMLLGDAAARHLGIDVGRERGILLALASMATAAAVAISGLIGFAGLVVPHSSVCSSGRRRPRTADLRVVGAALVSAADLVARLAGDVPVGVVMALLGAPFFLFLLQRTRPDTSCDRRRTDPRGDRRDHRVRRADRRRRATLTIARESGWPSSGPTAPVNRHCCAR